MKSGLFSPEFLSSSVWPYSRKLCLMPIISKVIPGLFQKAKGSNLYPIKLIQSGLIFYLQTHSQTNFLNNIYIITLRPHT